VTATAVAIPIVCPLCRASLIIRSRLPHIWHQPPNSPSFRIEWCAACDLGLLVPRPAVAELDRFYGADYFSKYADKQRLALSSKTTVLDKMCVHLAWRLERGRQLSAELVHETLGGRVGSVCDIGCGNGDLLAVLAARGHRVVGVESDEHARRRAAERGVEVHPGYAESLPGTLASEKYDAVILQQVLEHCLDSVAAFRNAAALLTVGGRLIIEVPNAGCTAGIRSGTVWYHCDAGRHVNFFTATSLRRLAESIGLRIESTFFGGYVTQFTTERLTAEQEVWDRLYEGHGTPAEQPRPSRTRLWGTLACTCLSPPSRKYETVGIIGRKITR
jgi:2-polyprenyl-3-methyl-5-hydroxy-6-metoxy-1,4-benzoquinol methylase